MGTSSSSPLLAKLDFHLLKPFFEVRISSAENFDRLAELTRTSSATFPSLSSGVSVIEVEEENRPHKIMCRGSLCWQKHNHLKPLLFK
jgi:hypothetical protein